MTYREWVTAMADTFGGGASEVKLILESQKALIPDPGADVDVKIAKTALCNEFAIMVVANITEGGYSKSWNMEGVKLWYNITCAELGRTPAGGRKLRDKSFVW
jgi:hypothetical protein